ncbi:MAG TPA: peptidoglycan DD-metalloendopeptidase family protein [Acidimicrobiales bacterium]|nr:peptidoglycan DD-metalloendopeptidase family protein [Acidimicrobiales bacterium]
MRGARVVAVLVAFAVVVPAGAPPALAEPASTGSREPQNVVAYTPPVDAPIVDPFRAPATPYAAGNRGIDYETTPGTPVRASAGGEVVFAGQVAGATHVVVLHADGVRTTYAFLDTATVARGDSVEQGDAVGTAGTRLHFGARVGDEYVDPLELLRASASSTLHAHLLPDADDEARRPKPVGEERAGLVRSLRGIAGAAGGVLAASVDDLSALATSGSGLAARAAQAKVDQLRLLAYYARETTIGTPAYLAITALEWSAEQEGCTPAASPPPPRPARNPRRIAILVGGLGSGTGRAAVLDVDTAALGYEAADVTQFSYRDDGPYTAADTYGDIGAAGERLTAYVRRIEAANPGVAVDLIAHSQGGLVARSALVHGLEGVATLVTLATPHQGADLATAGAALSTTVAGKVALRAAGLVAPLDPTATSIREMAATSSFLRELDAADLPPTTRVVSIAGEHDPVVPNVRAHLDGAANVVVDPGSKGIVDGEHSTLPGSPEATREIALAIAGLGPTCRILGERLRQEAIGREIALGQDLGGAALAAGSWWVGRRVPAELLPRF